LEKNMSRDFVITVDNSVSDEFCTEAIQYFKNADKAGLVEDRRNIEPHNRHEVSDFNTGLSAISALNTEACQILLADYINFFWKNVYEKYVDEYDILRKAAEHRVYNVKMQRTKPGQAFSNWHFEQMSRYTSIRILTFITYLNDIEEGGETEFLYYPKRIKPKKGTTILFPGSFSHTHRGNQPLKETKYILTGWVDY
tara:strand:- start:234 stop:824 length:591 start_codon:yes stop_codon:yes gene_type:complete